MPSKESNFILVLNFHYLDLNIDTFSSHIQILLAIRWLYGKFKIEFHKTKNYCCTGVLGTRRQIIQYHH